MSNQNIFEKASRQSLRFPTMKGSLTADDLWSLPLVSNTGKLNLDDIARGVSAKIKDSEVESFVNKSSAANEVEKLRLEIVKHIIGVKLAESEARKNERQIAERKQVLLEALNNKRRESLVAMSEAEIQAELDKIK